MGSHHGKPGLRQTKLMSDPKTARDHSIKALVEVTKYLPIGTNVGMLRLRWRRVKGRLLPEREATFPARQRVGLSAEAVWRGELSRGEVAHARPAERVAGLRARAGRVGSASA